MTTQTKPLGTKAYGSIPHLPGSRRGPADKGLTEQQASICLTKARDKHDVIIVQEKLDGSCCAVAKINGQIVALTRAGYPAISSPYIQHHHFAMWVDKHSRRFYDMVHEGERAVGEWLMEAHGTRYNLMHEPFVVFDLMRGHERGSHAWLTLRCELFGFTTPHVINRGGPMDIDEAMRILGSTGFHQADESDGPEGAVWRVERKGKVDFLAKYVRHDKVDGLYLSDKTGMPPIYNWQPIQ